jgi:hypothetical protein
VDSRSSYRGGGKYAESDTAWIDLKFEDVHSVCIQIDFDCGFK